MISSAPVPGRELHSRSSDGIHVRLMWHENGGHVWVAVSDMKAGSAFNVGLREGDRALDVFHHPYAYAAHYGIDTEGATQERRTASPTSA